MTEPTRYNYEQRIKELERSNFRLEEERRLYRTAAMDIFDGICASNNSSVNAFWVIQNLKRAFR